MRLITRYMLKHFLPVFALALLAFAGLYLIVDFFEKVDDLIEKHATLSSSIRYFLYKIPLIVTQGIPMAALLAAIIVFGLLRRNRELIALETAGIPPLSYVRPILLTALVISLAHFATGETVARTMSQKSQDIWKYEVRRKSAAASWHQENVWFHGQEALYQIRLYDGARQTMERVSLFYLDHSFRLVQRLDAKRFYWKDHQWVAEEGLIIRFDGQNTQQEWFAEKRLELSETPGDFAELETMPEELGWLDLYRYASKIRQEGYNATPYEVELHMRIAFPLTTLILTFLGITVALRQGVHGSIPLGIGIALIVAFFYLTVLNLGSGLSTAELLPPALGVWAGNVIFSILAGYFWIKDE